MSLRIILFAMEALKQTFFTIYKIEMQKEDVYTSSFELFSSQYQQKKHPICTTVFVENS